MGKIYKFINQKILTMDLEAMMAQMQRMGGRPQQ